MITMPMIVWLLMMGAMVFSWFVMAYQAHVIKKQAEVIRYIENIMKGDPNGQQGIDPGRESAG